MITIEKAAAKAGICMRRFIVETALQGANRDPLQASGDHPARPGLKPFAATKERLSMPGDWKPHRSSCSNC